MGPHVFFYSTTPRLAGRVYDLEMLLPWTLFQARVSRPVVQVGPGSPSRLRPPLAVAAGADVWNADDLDTVVTQLRADEDSARLLAIALARRGGSEELDEAQALARASLESNADDSEMLFVVGLAHEKRGEWEEAVDAYSEAVEVEPTDWRANFHLAKLSLNVGMVAAAAGHLRATLETNPDFAPAKEAMAKLKDVDVEAIQATLDESINEMMYGDGPGLPEPEEFDLTSLGDLFARPPEAGSE